MKEKHNTLNGKHQSWPELPASNRAPYERWENRRTGLGSRCGPRAPVIYQVLMVPAALVILLSGCDQSLTAPGASRVASKPVGPTQVVTLEVVRRDLEQTIGIPGTIEGYETADLYAKIAGYLAEINVDLGDSVQAGQPLATLSIPEMDKELAQKRAAIESARAHVAQSEASVRQAESDAASAEAMVDEAYSLLVEKQFQLKFRKAEFDRTRSLVESGSVLAKRLDEAQYQVDAAEAATKSIQARSRTAKAELESALVGIKKAEADRESALALVGVAEADAEQTAAMMQYATIRAPFAGVVIKRHADPGAFIQSAAGNSAARPVLTVTRTDIVCVTFDLPMQEVRWLDRGDPAVLDQISVLPGEKFVGQVTRFSPSLDAISRMMRVEIDLDNADSRLLPGYYGNVQLQLAQLPQTPVVPSSALLTDERGSYVYVVEDNTCRRRDVETNYVDGTIVGVSAGLTGGEQVIASGGGQLQDGQPVAAVPAK
jgi:HlyD family secretion protein